MKLSDFSVLISILAIFELLVSLRKEWVEKTGSHFFETREKSAVRGEFVRMRHLSGKIQKTFESLDRIQLALSCWQANDNNKKREGVLISPSALWVKTEYCLLAAYVRLRIAVAIFYWIRDHRIFLKIPSRIRIVLKKCSIGYYTGRRKTSDLNSLLAIGTHEYITGIW